MQISVIGSGYVGLVAATCLAELGHKVVCVDSDLTKIAALNAGETLIHEDYLQELLSRHRGNRLLFSTDLRKRRESQRSFLLRWELHPPKMAPLISPALKPWFNPWLGQ